METKEEVRMLEQTQFPLLIVVKDDLESNIIAQKLASFLKFPLINQNDITQAVLNLTNETQVPSEFTHKLPFEIVHQIASTQLKLRINVVINSSIFDSAHLNTLEKLANSEEAHLIIIECNDQEEDDHGYDARKIIKLKINKESFDEKKVVADMYFSLSHVVRDEVSEENSIIREIEFRDKKPINDHLHELILYEKPRKDKLVCKCCSQFISGSCYQCTECDEFSLHKSCTESAPNIKVFFESPPPFLVGEKFDHYYFEQTYKCNNCQDFSYHCYDCLLHTHFKHGIVPTILNCKQHPHPLNFIIMPLRYNYHYQCCICDKLGSSVSYKCYDCNYDVHVNCVLPGIIKMRNGELSFSLKSISSPDMPRNCDCCNEKIDSSQLFYHSKDPVFDIHLKCMPDESLVYLLISKKELEKASIKEIGLSTNEKNKSHGRYEGQDAYPSFIETSRQHFSPPYYKTEDSYPSYNIGHHEGRGYKRGRRIWGTEVKRLHPLIQ